ncbi:uncharacterized protein [Rutidosis leptorrhynchoides]|uniref:uncharacterized protein n=1 Tax=Rutidosis leptorrhynchoides TaxID=125765 RepID=UPI003A99409C
MGAYGGFGYGVINEEGRLILEFAIAHDLVVANSFFKKKNTQLATYHSGGYSTKIDFFLLRKGDLRTCKDCKVLPTLTCSSQHRILVTNLGTQGRVQTKVALKQARFRELTSFRGCTLADKNSIEKSYKEAKRAAKIAVTRAKDKVYGDLYKRLDSKKGANNIYRRAKARDRRRRDLDNIKYIKDEISQSIVKEDKIRK